MTAPKVNIDLCLPELSVIFYVGISWGWIWWDCILYDYRKWIIYTPMNLFNIIQTYHGFYCGAVPGVHGTHERLTQLCCFTQKQEKY